MFLPFSISGVGKNWLISLKIKHRQIQLERPVRNDFNLSRLPYFVTAYDAENRFRDLKFELTNDEKGNVVVWEVIIIQLR